MKKWFKNKFLVITCILIVLGGLFFWNTQRKDAQKAKIETVAVQEKDITQLVTSSGKTKARAQVDLHFQTGGRLAWVGVAEGDQVEAFTTLATLDSREVQKNLEKVLRDYSKERDDFEQEKLVTYKDQVVTDTLKRVLEKNQWDLEKAVLDVELKSIALEWSQLITPIAGVVIHVSTPVAGVNVTSADTFTVANIESFIFSANIDESDIGKILVRQSTEIHLDAFSDKTFYGKVTKIAYAAETSSGGTSVYPVEVEIENSENLRLGLNGDVSINISEKKGVLSVPLEAVREDEKGNKYVVVKTGQSYKKQAVQTGIETDTEVEITQGVASDTTVVTAGFEFLPKEITS